MRAEIAKLQQDMGVTTIYVTHDQVEAMTMGHRVAVMRKGLLQQVDAPQTLYDYPMNLFVAGFIGSPPMNMVEGRIEVSDGTVWAIVGEERLHVDPANVSARPALRGYDGRSVAVGIRPEDMYDVLEKPDAPADQRLHASVLLTEALGRRSSSTSRSTLPRWRPSTPRSSPPTPAPTSSSGCSSRRARRS
jgi:multiple sugar transport system ATP-binding protein